MIRLTSQKDDFVCGVKSRPWWDPSGWQQNLRAEGDSDIALGGEGSGSGSSGQVLGKCLTL